MSAELYELEAKLLAASNKVRAPGGLPPPPSPLDAALRGTNAGVPGGLFAPPEGKTYYSPRKLNAAGWTNPNGEVFVTSAGAGMEGGVANTAAHEGYHARQTGIRGMPLPPGAPDDHPVRHVLANNMEAMQSGKTYGKLWGMDPNSSREEQIASIAGYEGSLPAGTALTQTPEGQQILKADKGLYPMMSDQRVKDYYMEKSTLPYQGVWEGQSPPTPWGTRAKQMLHRGLVGMGINTVNRK